MKDLSGSKILVTGGSGFIGSNFINLLYSKYNNILVCNIDKLGVGSRKDYYPENMDDDSRYFLYSYDLCNKGYFDSMAILLREFDYIFHFAAESHVDRSIENPEAFIENATATGNLLSALKKHNPNVKIICISTDEVYGHLNDSDDPFTIDHPLLPNSPYSASKASSDLIARSFVQTFGMDIKITRCCNNFGPYQHDEKFIPTIIQSIVNGTKIPVYGAGLNVREWIHVDEHNNKILDIMDRGESGGIYNIGSGKELSNLGLIQKILDILFNMGKIDTSNIDDYVEFVEDRKGHDFRYAIEENFTDWSISTKSWDDYFVQTVEHYFGRFMSAKG